MTNTNLKTPVWSWKLRTDPPELLFLFTPSWNQITKGQMTVQLGQTPAKQPKQRALTLGPRSDIQRGCAGTGFICDTLAHNHPPCSVRCFQRAVRFSKRFGQELQNHIRIWTVLCILCRSSPASPLLTDYPQHIQKALSSYFLTDLWQILWQNWGRVPLQDPAPNSLHKSFWQNYLTCKP